MSNTTLTQLIDGLKMAEGALSSVADKGNPNVLLIVEHLRKLVAGADDVKITIDLNIFDDEGNVVDGTTSDLTVGQISDIVDHAAQLALMARVNPHITNIGQVLDEMTEALQVADVIGPDDSVAEVAFG